MLQHHVSMALRFCSKKKSAKPASQRRMKRLARISRINRRRLLGFSRQRINYELRITNFKLRYLSYLRFIHSFDFKLLIFVEPDVFAAFDDDCADTESRADCRADTCADRTADDCADHKTCSR